MNSNTKSGETPTVRSVSQCGRIGLLHFKYIRFGSNLFDIRPRWSLKMTPSWLKTRSTAECAAGMLAQSVHELPDKPVCLDSVGYGARMPGSHHRHRPSPDICSSAAMRSLSLTGMMTVVQRNWQKLRFLRRTFCSCGNRYFWRIFFLATSTILDRESDRSIRWIKEAVHIRKEKRRSMNRDEGSYTLSHTYDRFLATSHYYRGKN